MIMVVNKAPANLVNSETGDILAVFTETGVYFVYMARDSHVAYVSHLTIPAKSENVPIPQEYVEGLEETAMDASEALKNVAAVKTMAETAKSAAESLSYTMNGRYHGSYDRKTEGRDTFIFNAFDYYKISDFVITNEEILDFTGTNVNNVARSTVSNGENCVECGLFIVINRAGRCSLTIDTINHYFTAPSTGLYACYNGAANDMTAGFYDFRFNVVVPMVTNPSTRKKYYITVDDTGQLKATEIT